MITVARNAQMWDLELPGMRNKAFAVILLIGLPLSTSGESERKERPKASTEQQANSSNKKAQMPPPKGKSKITRDFIPSEKISADNPVSFPADI